MRLWTVHPRFLDAKGLTAAWREGLLARKVLRGQTRGYRNHPQLIRFAAHPEPLAAIDVYLIVILKESLRRGYRYDASKIDAAATARPIEETSGQLEYEWNHLLEKLQRRDPSRWREVKDSRPEPHPLFVIGQGGVRDWEKR